MTNFVQAFSPALFSLGLFIATPTNAQTTAQSNIQLEKLERGGATLQRLRTKTDGTNFLKVHPEAGQVNTHTSLGELIRWSHGLQPGANARHGEPLIYIAAALEGLDGSSLKERAARLSLFRDMPVSTSIRLGLQLLLEAEKQPKIPTDRSHTRSTLAPYASLRLLPGLNMKGTAAYTLNSDQNADGLQEDENSPRDGFFIAAHLDGSKSWKGISLTPDAGFRVVTHNRDTRTQFFLQPKLSTSLKTKNGMLITPRATFKGRWRGTGLDDRYSIFGGFDLEQIEINTELGLSLNMTNGLAFDFAAPSLNIDQPLASSFSGSVKFKIPLGNAN